MAGLQHTSALVKLRRASKEIHGLRKALSEPKAEQGAGGGAPKPLGRSPLGRADGQRTGKEGGSNSRESSCTQASASSHRADGGKKRPAPSSVGERGVSALGLLRGQPSGEVVVSPAPC